MGRGKGRAGWVDGDAGKVTAFSQAFLPAASSSLQWTWPQKKKTRTGQGPEGHLILTLRWPSARHLLRRFPRNVFTRRPQL